jgi:aminomethyltransferase
MVSFAGWDMPVQYSSIREEHNAVRSRSGLFDVSHMGEFVFSGSTARDMLQYLTANNLDGLKVGACHYSFFLNESGGTVDDTMIYRRGENDFLAVVNASNIQKDWDHIQSVAQRFPGADVRDESLNYALLALQGPRSFDVVQPLLSRDVSDLPFHAILQAEIASHDVLVATSGYTGENGVELFVAWEVALEVWEALNSTGEVTPCGLGARDTLRLEASLALYGHELDEKTTPIEAKLGFAVAKSGTYIGSEAIARQRSQGTKKTLVMIEMLERGIPRQGYPILSSEGEPLGEVTSGSMTPWLDKGIAMGYIKTEAAVTGIQVGIEIRGNPVKAVQVKRPFYKRPKRR